MQRRTLAVLLLSLVVPAAVVAQDHPELRVGTTIAGMVSGEAPATYVFHADGAGALTVVAHTASDADLVLVITDDVGQQLADGYGDADLGGHLGSEKVTAVIPAPGEYRIIVRTSMEPGEFQLAASWVTFQPFAVQPDPDGKPDVAQQLSFGSPLEDSLDPAGGDERDWYVVTVDADSVVTIVTESDVGDLVLEAFAPNAFAEAIDYSDQDMGGKGANESLTARLGAGESLYIKVSAFGSAREPIPYTIRAGRM